MIANNLAEIRAFESSSLYFQRSVFKNFDRRRFELVIEFDVGIHVPRRKNICCSLLGMLQIVPSFRGVRHPAFLLRFAV